MDIDLSKLPLALQVEIEENALRKDLTQSELAEQQERILAALREQTQQGRRTDLEDETPVKPFTEVRATAEVGRMFGESHMKVEKRLAVAKAAREEPETFGKLLADMDRTGRVEAPYRRLKAMRQSIAIRAEPPPLPGNGPYRVGAGDPPWPYEVQAPEVCNHRGVRPYPTMTIDQICALDVASIMHEDSIFWLWTDNFHLINGDAKRVLDAWGFKPVTLLTWVKDKMGLGHWLRGQSEQCIMATRGKPTVFLTDETTVLYAPVGRHSEKPSEFYTMVERLCPAPRYAELFARRSRGPKWDSHGDEAEPRAAE